MRMCCAKQKEKESERECGRRERLQERASLATETFLISTATRCCCIRLLSAATAWQQQLETCHRMWHDEAQSCQLRRQLCPCSAAQSTHYTHKHIHYVCISICVCVCLTLDIARKTKRNERNIFTFQRNYLRRDERKYIELLPLPLPQPLPGDGNVRGVWWSIAWHYLSAARQREARSYSEAVAADGRTTSARTLE